jgi:hypothetical protein
LKPVGVDIIGIIMAGIIATVGIGIRATAGDRALEDS